MLNLPFSNDQIQRICTLGRPQSLARNPRFTKFYRNVHNIYRRWRFTIYHRPQFTNVIYPLASYIPLLEIFYFNFFLSHLSSVIILNKKSISSKCCVTVIIDSQYVWREGYSVSKRTSLANMRWDGRNTQSKGVGALSSNFLAPESVKVIIDLLVLTDFCPSKSQFL
jgi:hypothetical protein